MFSDDRFMTLATGLVLAIVVGTIAQKSDTVMAFFGAGGAETVASDQFTVKAGKDQTLDILANDTLAGEVVITRAPSCGAVDTNADGSVSYGASGDCSGEVVFAYCIKNEDLCEEAEVKLSVINLEPAAPVVATAEADVMSEPSDNIIESGPASGAPAETTPAAVETATFEPVITTTTTPSSGGDRFVPTQILVEDEGEDTSVVGFGVAQAPTLFAPDFAELIQPQETVDTLRRSVAGVAPSQIAQDENIAAQSSASTPSRVELSSGTLQASPSFETDSAAPVIAMAAPSQPRVGVVPMLAPAQQDAPLVRGPDVDTTVPVTLALDSGTTNDDPVSVSDVTDQPTSLASASAPYGQEPANPPENVDTLSADAGNVRIAAEDPADSSDIVVEMAAQIILPSPHLTQNLDRNEQATPEVEALLSDENFVANLEPSAPPVKEPVEVASLPAAPAVTAVPETPAVAQECAVQMSATARPGAEISIFVVSPCHASELVTIEHAGLSFTARMDDSGSLSTTIPALTDLAIVNATFEDGAAAQSQIQVRDAKDVERIAVVWSAPVSIDLHAFENGAKENEPGHVWSGNPRKYRDTLTGGGGYMQTFGDPEIVGGTVAEVYSLPTNRLRKETNVQMDLSIDDSTRYCGQAMILKTIRTQKNSDPTVRSFNLALPDCASAGNVLVLENFIEAISVARR